MVKQLQPWKHVKLQELVTQVHPPLSQNKSCTQNKKSSRLKGYFDCSPIIVDKEGLNIRSLRVSMKAYGAEMEDDRSRKV
jgi:hypothetical protein